MCTNFTSAYGSKKDMFASVPGLLNKLDISSSPVFTANMPGVIPAVPMYS